MLLTISDEHIRASEFHYTSSPRFWSESLVRWLTRPMTVIM